MTRSQPVRSVDDLPTGDRMPARDRDLQVRFRDRIRAVRSCRATAIPGNRSASRDRDGRVIGNGAGFDARRLPLPITIDELLAMGRCADGEAHEFLYHADDAIVLAGRHAPPFIDLHTGHGQRRRVRDVNIRAHRPAGTESESNQPGREVITALENILEYSKLDISDGKHDADGTHGQVRPAGRRRSGFAQGDGQ